MKTYDTKLYETYDPSSNALCSYSTLFVGEGGVHGCYTGVQLGICSPVQVSALSRGVRDYEIVDVFQRLEKAGPKVLPEVLDGLVLSGVVSTTGLSTHTARRTQHGVLIVHRRLDAHADAQAAPHVEHLRNICKVMSC